jgi:DnaJ-domain-containing protein 1
MPFDFRKLGKYRVGMLRRIADLKVKSEDSLDVAMDTMMQDRVDSYFRIEQGFAEIDHSLATIEAELPLVGDLATAQRLEARLEFVEDRYDELDSEVRERPRRRRRKINLTDFFKAASGGGGAVPGQPGEINTAGEAYEVLGLEFGSSMTAVTKAYRERVKKLHPDTRKGDRSSEPQLRRILEAYQLLKEYLSLSNLDPTTGVRGGFTPTE